jgi:hypothetical protein
MQFMQFVPGSVAYGGFFSCVSCDGKYIAPIDNDLLAGLMRAGF